MSYSKDDLQTEFNLSQEDMRKTLTACGLSTRKHKYTQEEKARFAEARRLINEQKSYQDVTDYFRERGIIAATGEELDEVDGRPINSLDDMTLQLASQISSNQAEQILQLIPLMTMKRLQDMIASGQMREEFQRLWNVVQIQSGNAESLLMRVEEDWEEVKQLPLFPSQKSLPESSTESSNND